jgi:flagellar motor switch protein FliG
MGVGKLTGPKKAAILLLALGEEGAAEVMQNLEEAEIQQVGYYMTRFNDISAEELDTVLEEFYRQSVMSDGGVDINASPDFVRNALAKALGPDKAKEIGEQMSASQDDSGLDSLNYIDPIMISNYIRGEHPQTIALIISYLSNTDQAATVLRTLPENLQADVVYRMATLESIPPGVVNELNDVLFEEMKAAGSMVTKVGGVQPVAEILNAIDKASETRILSTIEESNPDLAEQIRELMFTFEDLTLIDSKQMQTILKDIDKADLAMAMKTASDAVKELIFSSMSSRAAEMLQDDLENMGPVKVADVEGAQQKIIKVVKKLEEEGKIVVAGGGEDIV